MDIVAHIRQLLVLHDCVIIPGFGGFVANYQPAEINFAQNSFSPPSKKIGFNQNLSENDGLLIGHISARQEVGYVEARRVVTDFVKQVRDRLEKGKAYHFEEIGKFQYDRQKNLQFEPDNTFNYLVDSFGLSRFTANPVEAYDVRKKIRKFRDQPPSERKGMNKVVKRVLIAVPILVALALIPLKTHYLDNLNIDLSSFEFLKKTDTVAEPVKSPEPPAASYEEAVSRTETPAEEPAVAEVNQPAEESVATPAPVEQARYLVIAGSFRNLQNAENLRSRLESSGFASEIHEAGNGLYRVSMAAFSDYDKAMTELDRLRKTPGRQSVWLLKD